MKPSSRLLVWKVRPRIERAVGDVAPRVHAWAFDMGRAGMWWYPTKRRALQVALTTAREAGPKARISLRIYRSDGSVQEERTYPRSADPRRSKG